MNKTVVVGYIVDRTMLILIGILLGVYLESTSPRISSNIYLPVYLLIGICAWAKLLLHHQQEKHQKANKNEGANKL